MIQRIQSVYLFLVFVLSVLFITGAFYHFTDTSGQIIVVRFTGSYTKNGNILQGRDMFILVLSVVIPIFTATSIFLYNNRRFQSRMVILVIVLDIILIGLLVDYIVHKWGNGFSNSILSYRSVIPIINLILLLLALLGIRKDESFVKSYDRIR